MKCRGSTGRRELECGQMRSLGLLGAQGCGVKGSLAGSWAYVLWSRRSPGPPSREGRCGRLKQPEST